MLRVQGRNGPAQRVELVKTIAGQADHRRHLLGQAVHGDLHMKALTAASCPLQRPLDLLVRTGKTEESRSRAILPGLDLDSQLGQPIEICREMPSIVERLQLHAVAVHDAIGGDHPNASLDQVESHCPATYPFDHLHRH